MKRKKLNLILIISAMVFLLFACGKEVPEDTEEETEVPQVEVIEEETPPEEEQPEEPVVEIQEPVPEPPVEVQEPEPEPEPEEPKEHVTELNLNDYSTDVYIETPGIYHVTGTLNNAFLSVRVKEDVILRLEDVEINSQDNPAIYAVGELKIELDDDNKLTSKFGKYLDNNACIYAEESLRVNGDGKLKIRSDGNGLYAREKIVITDGKLDVDVEMEGIISMDHIQLDGGELKLKTVGDCVTSQEEIYISGGKITALSELNDAFDSNKTIHISGGEIEAIATHFPECPFDCDKDAFEILGGTITGVGSANSIPTDSEIPVLVAGIQGTEVYSEILIKEEENDHCIFWFPFKDRLSDDLIANLQSDLQDSPVTVLFVTSPEFVVGKKYKIYTECGRAAKFTLHEGVNVIGEIPQPLGKKD